MNKRHYIAEEIYVNEEIYVIGSCGYIVLRQIIRFNGHIPGEPGLPGFIEAKDDGSGGDNWSYKSCKPPVKSSPPTN